MTTVPSVPRVFHQPLASDQTLEFSWEAPLSDGGSALTGYRITITPQGGSPIIQTIADPTAIYWKETGLINNTWYEISLEAQNAVGYSDPAFFRSFQPGSKPDYPPATATATVISPGKVTVSWTAPTILPDATIYWYSIYARSSNPSDPEVSAGGDGQAETSIVIEGLNPLSSYYFDVYAVNCPGYSPVAVTGTINFNILNANWAATILGEGAVFSTNNTVAPFNTIGYNIAKDQLGNLYMLFAYNGGTVGFVNVKNLDGSSSSIYIQGASNSVGLVKYNVSGIAQWATGFGSLLALPTPAQIAFDSSNNVYITGSYRNVTAAVILRDASGTTQVNSAFTLPTTTATINITNMFLIKYNPNGVVQWATALRSTTTTIPIITRSVQIDSLNNIYVSGTYGQTSTSLAVLDVSGNGQSTSLITLPVSALSGNGYIIKYNSNGISQWATYTTGSSFSSIGSSKLDASNNLYITGFYSGTSTILKDANGNSQIDSPSGNNLAAATGIYIMKYNSNGVSQWATYFPTGFSVASFSINLDSSSNIYITGNYQSASLLTLQDVSGIGQSASSITLPDTSGVGQNVFLVKYSNAGITQWATYISGTGTDAGRGIAFDNSNNIYIVGTYNSSSTVILQDASGNSQAPSSVTLPDTSGNGLNGFLVKYSSTGITQWATYIQGNFDDYGYSIFIDNSNRIYITGQYSSTIDVILKDVSGNTQVNSSLILPKTVVNTINSAYIIKYTSEGIVSERSFIPCLGKAMCFFGYKQMKIDLSGNIYICSQYQYYYSNDPIVLRNADGSTSSVTLPVASVSLPFLIKYNSSGIVQWATYLNTSTVADIFSISTDSSNNIYISGQYTLSLSINDASGNTQVPSLVTLPPSSSSSNYDMYLLKYNSNGICQWATYLNGTLDDIAYGLAIDPSNNIYITGYYNSASTLVLKDASGNTQQNSPSGINLPATPNNDALLVKYNSNGISQWATYFSGATGSDQATVITIDASNNLYIAGQYLNTSVTTLKDVSGNTQQDSTITLRATGASIRNAFLIKYTSNGIVQWATSFGDSTTGATYVPFSLAIDTSNNVYMCGQYINTSVAVTLRDASGNTSVASTIQLPVSVAGDPFLIKYSSAGIVQWATCFSDSTNGSGRNISIDSSNNIYMTGNYRTTSLVTLKDASGNGQVVSTKTLPAGTGLSLNIQGYLIKYNSNGIVQYATSFSGDILATRMFWPQFTAIYQNKLYQCGVYACTVSPIVPQNITYAGDVANSTSVTLPVSCNSMFLIQYSI